jgi:hypothetical protein
MAKITIADLNKNHELIEGAINRALDARKISGGMFTTISPLPIGARPTPQPGTPSFD